MTRKETIISSSVIGVIALMFLVVPSRMLAKVYFPIIGISFTTMGVVKLLLTEGYRKDKEFYYNIIEGFIAVVMGIVYTRFYKYLAVDIVSFILMSIIPTLRLVFAKKFWNQVLFDSLKYIGLFSLLGGYIVINNIFFYTFSFIWFSLYFYIVVSYLFFNKHNKGELYEED